MNADRRPGRAFVFGDNVDTDALAPGLYMKGSIETLARHCLEALDSGFAGAVRPGDFVVGGENFGMGSSREQAAMVLRQLGVEAVIARSFAGLFFRNCLNLGLAPLECAGAGSIQSGDVLTVDPVAGRIINRSRAQTYSCVPIPDHLLEMVKDGGLLPHLAKKLERQRDVS
ncbi:MAG: 3-isopropylmalate dehydratase [Alphaproteobacteria bacterium]|nr:3-isopropylmalate dehydratase [Alphaproteobacteria bacterium]